MNKGIVLLGIIILLVGFGLMVYSEQVRDYTISEGSLRKWVSIDEISPEYWDIIYNDELGEVIHYDGKQWQFIIYRESTKEVFMQQLGRKNYGYRAIYPYQVVGAIVTLIGIVTAIIGSYQK
ncbi:MAG: hypothetical protein JSW00_05725 [Thermoplasmata archaeon]|nr:MAG: hypothetical protein JSW00_05725 [Thermoplasmata archaeon]